LPRLRAFTSRALSEGLKQGNVFSVIPGMRLLYPRQAAHVKGKSYFHQGYRLLRYYEKPITQLHAFVLLSQ
jgi:hypothetical protein